MNRSNWECGFSSSAVKSYQRMPQEIKDVVDTLVNEIQALGPFRSNWPHYGKLKNNEFHCHLTRGRPTYVAVWVIESKAVKLVKITYVGTHENAPY